MCAGKHGNTDRFRAQEAQTLNFVQKNKEVMAAPPATRDAECMATNWDIADCQELERRRNDDIPDADDAALEEGGGKSQVSSSTNTKGRESATTPLTRYVNELVEANLASPGCLLQVDQDIKKALDHGLSAMAVHEASIRRDARRYDQQGATNQSGSTATGQSSRMLGSRVGINSSRTNIGGASRTNIGSSRTNIGGSRTNIGGSRTNIGGSRTNIGGSRTNIGGGGSRANVNQGSRQFSMSQSGMLEDDGRGKLPKIAPIDLNTVMAYRQSEKIMRHENLIPQFSIIERAIQQNIYHARHLLYRNFPSLALDEEEKGQKMINALSQHENGTTGTTEDTKNGEEEQDDFLRVEDPSRHGAPDASLSIIEDGHEDPHHSRPTMTTSSSGSNLNAAPTTNLPLVVLWNFVCDLTVGRTVSCMTWNTVNPDLLAVSYGSFNFNKQQDGLICFWSLKNPEFPQQIFRTACGVTSIDFSTLQPNLLAAGHYNGVVAVYDMNKQQQQQPTSSSSTSSTSQDNPILSSDQEGGSHMDAVWQVKWVNKGQERGESLVSISSDGRVTEWSMKKGLSFTNLMLFKRVSSGRSSDTNHSRSKQTSAATKTSGSAKSNSNNTSDGVISRQSSGLCLDFASHDSSVYFAGTEDGVIHKCSCSYNEQYLTSYFGHTGPIYRLALSPFWPSVFLSCSADWTVKLWHQGTPEALLTFHSTDLAHAVFDVAWSPSCPTIFGSVTQDGRIEIWDLETSSLDPVITWYQQTKESGVMTGLEEVLDVDHDVDHHPEESSTRVQCTRLIFAPTSPAVAVGDNHGKVGGDIPHLCISTNGFTSLYSLGHGVSNSSFDDEIAGGHDVEHGALSRETSWGNRFHRANETCDLSRNRRSLGRTHYRPFLLILFYLFHNTTFKRIDTTCTLSIFYLPFLLQRKTGVKTGD